MDVVKLELSTCPYDDFFSFSAPASIAGACGHSPVVCKNARLKNTTTSVKGRVHCQGDPTHHVLIPRLTGHIVTVLRIRTQHSRPLCQRLLPSQRERHAPNIHRHFKLNRWMWMDIHISAHLGNNTFNTSSPHHNSQTNEDHTGILTSCNILSPINLSLCATWYVILQYVFQSPFIGYLYITCKAHFSRAARRDD